MGCVLGLKFSKFLGRDARIIMPRKLGINDILTNTESKSI